MSDEIYGHSCSCHVRDKQCDICAAMGCVFHSNLEIFKEEAELSRTILKRNRVNTATGEWYGPDPDPRPCKGGNTNICVAEGCFGEACVKLAYERKE